MEKHAVQPRVDQPLSIERRGSVDRSPVRSVEPMTGMLAGSAGVAY